MSRMFGDRINEFVLSADIMSEDTFMELVELVSTYLAQQLDVVYFAVLQEGKVDGGTGLTTLWSSTDALPVFSVDSTGEYSSFSAHSFGKNLPLWVVSESQTELNEADDYRDMWSNSDQLPRYRPSSPSPVRTSVMHPLRRGNKAIGVLEFASDVHIRPTPRVSPRWRRWLQRFPGPIECMTSVRPRGRTPIGHSNCSKARSPGRVGHAWRCRRSSSPTPAVVGSKARSSRNTDACSGLSVR